MTNKEKLEIIDKKLEMLYEELDDLKNYTSDAQKNITQAIYNLESTRLLLENDIDFNTQGQEKIDENLPPFIEGTIEQIEEDDLLIEVKPTVYVCPVCKKEAIIYGDMIDGQCLKCNQKLIKKPMQ